MDPTMVEAEQSAELSQFIQSLYKRRQFLQQQLKEKKKEKICPMDTVRFEQIQQSNFMSPTESNERKMERQKHNVHLTINSLKTVEQQIQSFINIYREFIDGFFEQFSTLN
ncbi:hypothetical protein niasHT_023054 [Heterodera trifolii]|uniref:Uncharacterized protein n=1 Tax=Heterodera trifolii TaxID=157864 RepID=A0ABD2KF48_9BILA